MLWPRMPAPDMCMRLTRTAELDNITSMTSPSIRCKCGHPASQLPSSTWSLSCRVEEDHPIMSFTVSSNGRNALLNVALQVVPRMLWEAHQATSSLSLWCRVSMCGTCRTAASSDAAMASPRATTPSTPATVELEIVLWPVVAKVRWQTDVGAEPTCENAASHR